jgi:hypothetical protein
MVGEFAKMMVLVAVIPIMFFFAQSTPQNLNSAAALLASLPIIASESTQHFGRHHLGKRSGPDEPTSLVLGMRHLSPERELAG